ncbi:hypothetical protein MOQ_000195 [Trypanosoma cruzi marinkellei]|uniref:Uncharacterized protein n=1 Tax=Trypanosoma cruzi marinkellei TaxID=85056 RepID=K2NJJ9_TRYCR|nr:hypothetical protein MOQ_000195 [Trypanosoma cruzi marinkellei]
MNVTTHKYAGPYELWWRPFSPDGTIHPPARSSDADQTGSCQLPPPREGRDDTKSGGTTAPQVNAEPSRQNEDWRQSAAADGPNTVDQSPASNTATKTSETKPEFATNPNEMMVPNASNKRLSFANGPKIVVASNASGVISVTHSGREHVAADGLTNAMSLVTKTPITRIHRAVFRKRCESRRLHERSSGIKGRMP